MLDAIATLRSQLRDHPDDEATPCPCDSANDLALLDVDRNGLPLRLVLCRDCGLIRMDPQPSATALDRFYAQHYRAIYGPHVANEGMFASKAWKGELIARVLTAAGIGLKQGPIVDVGCGGGWALLSMGHAGVEKIGYDFDAEFLALGRTRGLDLRRGGVAQATADAVRAELLVAAHVLEHTKNPVAYLTSLRPLAAPRGKLYLEVPHFRRVRETLWSDSRTYWQRAHLWDFQRAHLEVLARRAGWAPIHSTEDHLSIELVCELATPEPALALPELGGAVESMLRSCEATRRKPLHRVKKSAYFQARRLKRALAGARG